MVLPQFDLYEFAKKDNLRVLILGATGSGKTYFAKKLVNKIQSFRTKVIVMDAKNEFNYKPLNYVAIGNWKSDRTIVKNLESYEVGGFLIDDPVMISEYLCAIAWEFAPSCLYLEEIVEYVGKNDFLPKSHYFLYKCLQQGRSRKIRMIMATQMIAQTNLALFRQSTDVFVFAMKKKELETVEKALSLEPESLKFKPEDLYRFYHVETLKEPVKYEKLDYKPRGRPKKTSKKTTKK